MSQVPRIGFDTSALNAFEEAGVNSEPLMCALQVGFEVNIFAINIDEVIATPNPARREALVNRCVRLLASGQCLWPHHWIVQLLIREYRRDAEKFDWQRVNVRAAIFEQALIRRTYTDQVCAEQRTHQFAMERDYAMRWNALRPKLAPLLANLRASQRPANFLQAVQIAEREGGVLWSIGAELYKYETGSSISEDEMKAFMRVCPPFRSVCYAQIGTWFDRALRPSHSRQPKVGRNDSMMATYLPYCEKFVARDWAQTNRFLEIASSAQIDCEVLSYADFCKSFAVCATAARE